MLLSHKPDDQSLIEEALTAKAEHKVIIAVPKLGERKYIVDQAQNNAKEALGRHLSESNQQAILLARVAEIFGMTETPKRIEVYDNSHISGSEPVGAMIAAGPEGFLKKTYRKFNITGRDYSAPDAKASRATVTAAVNSADDYAMMNEVLTRRFRRLIDEDPTRQSGMWPDLVLVDGGLGQLGKARTVMQELGLHDIVVAGIAKGPDRNADANVFLCRIRSRSACRRMTPRFIICSGCATRRIALPSVRTAPNAPRR